VNLFKLRAEPEKCKIIHLAHCKPYRKTSICSLFVKSHQQCMPSHSWCKIFKVNLWNWSCFWVMVLHSLPHFTKKLRER